MANYEGEILAGAVAVVAALLSFRGVKIRIEHVFRRDRETEIYKSKDGRKNGKK